MGACPSIARARRRYGHKPNHDTSAKIRMCMSPSIAQNQTSNEHRAHYCVSAKMNRILHGYRPKHGANAKLIRAQPPPWRKRKTTEGTGPSTGEHEREGNTGGHEPPTW